MVQNLISLSGGKPYFVQAHGDNEVVRPRGLAYAGTIPQRSLVELEAQIFDLMFCHLYHNRVPTNYLRFANDGNGVVVHPVKYLLSVQVTEIASGTFTLRNPGYEGQFGELSEYVCELRHHKYPGKVLVYIPEEEYLMVYSDESVVSLADQPLEFVPVHSIIPPLVVGEELVLPEQNFTLIGRMIKIAQTAFGVIKLLLEDDYLLHHLTFDFGSTEGVMCQGDLQELCLSDPMICGPIGPHNWGLSSIEIDGDNVARTDWIDPRCDLETALTVYKHFVDVMAPRVHE
jgi:hypothetical protein